MILISYYKYLNTYSQSFSLKSKGVILFRNGESNYLVVVPMNKKEAESCGSGGVSYTLPGTVGYY
jgi:hypothetical protein